MAKKSVAERLYELSQVDAQYYRVHSQRQDAEKHFRSLEEELQERRARLTEAESAVKEGKLRQVLEEHELRDEHAKIVDRRKQLVAIGGAKVAKLLEREIASSTAAIHVKEEVVLHTLEVADAAEHRLVEMREGFSDFEKAFESAKEEYEDIVPGLEKELKAFEKEREKLFSVLDDRVKLLYGRVERRYPGSVVALAENQSCRCCFRALPPQTYNQVLLGNNLIQCPGCMRILVVLESAAA